MYNILKPCGEIVLGDFHERYDFEVFLDYILNWEFIYRTEEDIHRLLEKTLFKDSVVTIGLLFFFDTFLFLERPAVLPSWIKYKLKGCLNLRRRQFNETA